MVVLAALVLVCIAPLVGAWWQWPRCREHLARWRMLIAAAGLATVSLAMGGYVVCLALVPADYLSYAWTLPGWAQTSLYLAPLALLFSLFGRGPSRLLGAASSVLTGALLVAVLAAA